MSNRNIFWAKTFADELARCGLQAVCIAPGSRSTPLVIAFAENPHIKVYSHIDERSCAFFALGLALATDKPVAVVCSSGTATANFHPAVIEARYANVPLLVLTADRQHELRESGANQTVDQIKMYGDHVLWFYDVALPEANPPAVAIRNLRTLADRAYAKANGIEKGPVHLNFPFRKPLEPTPVAGDVTDIEPRSRPDNLPHTLISRGELRPSREQLQALIPLINQAKRGLIVCGPRFDGQDETFSQFVNATGYPVFADALSGARFNPSFPVITGYDTFLGGEPLFEAPDLILHFGAMPASAHLENYLNRIDTEHRILITENGVWTDAYHRLSMLIQASPSITCDLLRRFAKPEVDSTWVKSIQSIDSETREAVDQHLQEELFDGSGIWMAAKAAAETAPPLYLFCASSLPVRHLEQYMPVIPKFQGIFSNRGASGIDGTISSALGVAAANPDVTVLLITGDLAFYHDMNGLLAVKRANINNITILLINNDGGGIFQRLPISQFDPPFTDLFLTPHGLNFEPAVRMYGLDYHQAESLVGLRETVKSSVESGKATVIEIRTDSKRDLERRNEINGLVMEHLREKFGNRV
jgi:2-succinyl-5-enolpyruvyl-6-hydroxy-3-cyclohexene-1-carboxylate synthase